MYIDRYGFREHPFQMTPDARLYYASSVHSRAYAHLMYGIAQGEGFVVVTGEVGAGKTTLVERLCAELDPTASQSRGSCTTQVSGDDLLRLVADAFGAACRRRQGHGAARHHRARSKAAARRHLLIVDEAQALPPAALEELRMLSNVTDGSRALLQTVLLGQPQLRQIIASPDLDQLRQRVLASLPPLRPLRARRRTPMSSTACARWAGRADPHLGARCARAGSPPQRRHPAPHQPALLARAAERRAGAEPMC